MITKRIFSPGFSSLKPRLLSTSQGPIHIYDARVKSKILKDDGHQRAALYHLQRLYEETVQFDLKYSKMIETPRPQDSVSFFGFSSATKTPTLVRADAPQGVYLWGGVGCGKTFMMDLFYEALPEQYKKRRVHFNNFMIDVHKRLHRIKGTKVRGDNPVAHVARDLVSEAYILCFDEFQVTDVADAMILKGLFSEMFEYGAIVIATSNRPPSDLYKNGLQRESFLPFIPLLSRRCKVHSLTESKTDYRLLKYSYGQMNLYLAPINDENTKAFNDQYTHICQKEEPSSMEFLVDGHKLVVPSTLLYNSDKKRSKPGKVAKFSFNDLCGQPLGAADYIFLAETFDCIFIENIPKLTMRDLNEIRRMITLVDVLYEYSVVLVSLADAIPLKLFELTHQERSEYVQDEVFAFDRCVSRLMEMQSEVYLKGKNIE